MTATAPVQFGKFNNYQHIALQNVGQDPATVLRYALETRDRRERETATQLATAMLENGTMSNNTLNNIGSIMETTATEVTPALFQAYLGARYRNII